MSETYPIDASSPAERAIFLREFNNLRGMVEITIKPISKLRSSAANRFYWAVVVKSFRMFLVAQGQPWSANACHQMLAGQFLRETVFHPTTGEVIADVTRSTTTLSTAEFSAYCQNCEEFLTGLGVQIPSVHEFTGGEPEYAGRVQHANN